MRVVLSTFGGRGDVEPLVALASRLRELGVEVRACAPPDGDFVERFAAVGVELVPVGPSARELAVAAPRPSSIPEAAARIVAEPDRRAPRGGGGLRCDGGDRRDAGRRGCALGRRAGSASARFR